MGGTFVMIAILGSAALAALAAYIIGWEHAVLRLRPQIDRILEQNDP
jgi:hypothetical protein